MGITLLKKSRDPQVANFGKKRLKKATVGKMLVKTFTLLSNRLKNCVPHYIRCIRSNDKNEGFGLNKDNVLKQVKHLNLTSLTLEQEANFIIIYTFEEFMQRYRIICDATWPTCDLNAEDGTRKILESVVKNDAEYHMGSKKIFIRRLSISSMLEKKRAKELPRIVTLIQKTCRGFCTRRKLDKESLANLLQKLFRGMRERINFKEYRAALLVQKHWKGHSVRKYIKKNKLTIIRERDAERMLRATLKIQRRVNKWLHRRFVNNLLKDIEAANTKEMNWGKNVRIRRQISEGGEESRPILEKMRRLHWGRQKIKSLGTKESIEDMKLKIVSNDLFEQKKPWDCNRPFKRDYMSEDSKSNYKEAIETLFSDKRDKEIIFSDKILKVNRKNKPQEQLLVITDQNIYRYDTKKVKMVKEGIPLQQIIGLNLSPFSDNWMVIKMNPPARDMVLDLGISGEEHYSELVTLLYEALKEKDQKISITFEEKITYDNGRTEKGPGKPTILNFIQLPAEKKEKHLGIFTPGKGHTATVYYK